MGLDNVLCLLQRWSRSVTGVFKANHLPLGIGPFKLLQNLSRPDSIALSHRTHEHSKLAPFRVRVKTPLEPFFVNTRGLPADHRRRSRIRLIVERVASLNVGQCNGYAFAKRGLHRAADRTGINRFDHKPLILSRMYRAHYLIEFLGVVPVSRKRLHGRAIMFASIDRSLNVGELVAIVAAASEESELQVGLYSGLIVCPRRRHREKHKRSCSSRDQPLYVIVGTPAL